MIAAAASSVAVAEDAESARPQVRSDGSSYRQSLRSSAIVGGSSAINMLIGLVRTKVVAMVLGPSGVGLMGALSNIADLARTLAELGINNSGVRQIAESVGTGDTARIARTVTALRRVAIALGLIGGGLLATFAAPVSTLTFGDNRLVWTVALLGLAVFFRLVADGQGALLQGMRQIGDIARINVYSSLASTVLAIAFVFWLGERGVIVVVVGGAAASLMVSWWYSRQLKVEVVAMPTHRLVQEARALLRLGLAFMTSALLTTGAAYVVRIILIRSDGLGGAGLYQAAWAVGGLFVSFVLQAMGTDFYPRLVALANDDEQGNRLVNEQATVSMLIALTGVLGTLTLTPLAITILYSVEFAAAVDILRWICLGMALRIVTWPLGYVLVAKGKQVLFVGADLIWTVTNIVLTWLCVREFGLVGAGIAFFASYVVHVCVVYPMCRRLSGFRWSGTTARIGLVFLSVIGLTHVSLMALPGALALVFGLIVTLVSAVVCAWMLRRLVSPERVPRRLTWIVFR